MTKMLHVEHCSATLRRAYLRLAKHILHFALHHAHKRLVDRECATGSTGLGGQFV